jgi:hypothetical protein
MFRLITQSDAAQGTLVYGLFTAGLLDVVYFIVFTLG